MSNRSQFLVDVAQMGTVWVASLSLFGISVIGNTQASAIEAAMEAFRTHALMGEPGESCEVCS